MPTSTTCRAHATTAARDELIRGNIELASRIAGRMCRTLPRHISLDDVKGAALLGLAEAAERYDAARGIPFPAFAAKRVRGAVLDQLRREDVLSRQCRQKVTRLNKARQVSAARYGSHGTDARVAAHAGLQVRDIRALDMTPSRPPVSLDDSHATLAANELGADERIANAERVQSLNAAVAALPRRQQLVLRLYYREELTLKEIGQRLGITESRVCQLRTGAERLLRRRLAARTTTLSRRDRCQL